jgi:hypothetical protein
MEEQRLRYIRRTETRDKKTGQTTSRQTEYPYTLQVEPRTVLGTGCTTPEECGSTEKELREGHTKIE